MINLQPIVTTGRTKEGNQYNKSNIGKYAATASIATGTAVYGGGKAVKALTKGIKNIKNITALKNMLPDFHFKTALQGTINFAKSSVKFVKQGAKTFSSFAKKGMEVLTKIASKVKPVNIKNMATKAAKVVQTYPAKAAKFANFGIYSLSLIAGGFAADYAVNKINAHQADKKA